MHLEGKEVFLVVILISGSLATTLDQAISASQEAETSEFLKALQAIRSLPNEIAPYRNVLQLYSSQLHTHVSRSYLDPH